MEIELIEKLITSSILQETIFAIVPILALVITSVVSKRKITRSMLQRVLLPVLVFLIKILLKAIKDNNIKEHVNSINSDIKVLRRRIKAPNARG